MADERITKRRVTMRSVRLAPNGDTVTDEATDYVPDSDRPGVLDAYVAAARLRGWQQVEVSDELDAGPAGYHGATYIPASLDHPLAGQFFPADTPEESNRG